MKTPKVLIHTSTDSAIANLLFENKLDFQEVFEFGAKFKLAELGLIEYPNNKLANLNDILQKALLEANDKIENFNKAPKKEENDGISKDSFDERFHDVLD